MRELDLRIEKKLISHLADASESRSTLYYQLLVRIYQGKLFPPPREDDGRCPMVQFECRFNRESLETDPVPLTSSPVCSFPDIQGF